MIKVYDVNDQLFNFSMICQENAYNNKFSNWIFYAVSRYISTGRSTRDFDKKFCGLTKTKLKNMMEYALKGDLSDDEIMKSVKSYLRKQK